MSMGKAVLGSVGKRLIPSVFVPYNGKIADITHADTNKHTLDLASALSEIRKIIAVLVTTSRVTGSGALYVYPNEGTTGTKLSAYNQFPTCVIIADGTNRLQYALETANEDFDLYCFGYVVVG